MSTGAPGQGGLPVLAVMPFISSDAVPAGGGADGTVLIDGLHEDICGALTRFRGFRVISPWSAATVADLTDRAAGQRLGAIHVMRGRVRKDGRRFRLLVSLMSCAEDRQLWSERLEAPVDDIPGLQDDLVDRIAATLSARLDESALAAARRRPAANLAAHELTLRGMSLLRDGTLEADEAARQLFEQAAWYVDRAVALCPNDADLLIQAAILEVYLGRPETGIDHVMRAIRLNPYHSNDYYSIAAFIHFFARRNDDALAFRAKSDAMPFVDAAAYSALAYAYSGRMEEARAELARYHAEFASKIAAGRDVPAGEPLAWLLSINPFRRTEDVAYIREGFRLLDEDQRIDSPVSSFGSGPGSDMHPALTPARIQASLFRSGDGWIAEYGGYRAILPNLKGLRDIHRLLRCPGTEIHCLDLADRSETTFGADAALDEKARAALKLRIRDLQEDLADAEDANDSGRAEKARDEMETLIASLSRAFGLGGRGRRMGDDTERARSAVTWRVRYTLRKIGAAHPSLGRHLQSCLRTGVFCQYAPSEPVVWQLDDRLPTAGYSAGHSVENHLTGAPEKGAPTV